MAIRQPEQIIEVLNLKIARVPCFLGADGHKWRKRGVMNERVNHHYHRAIVFFDEEQRPLLPLVADLRELPPKQPDLSSSFEEEPRPVNASIALALDDDFGGQRPTNFMRATDVP